VSSVASVALINLPVSPSIAFFGDKQDGEGGGGKWWNGGEKEIFLHRSVPLGNICHLLWEKGKKRRECELT